MVLSLIHPNTCGFSKVIAWQLAKSTWSKATRLERETLPKFRSRISKLHYENFIQTFSECKENFCVDFATFQSKYPDLQAKFVKWNSRKINERAIYVSTFDLEKWKKLPSSKKAEHNLVECRGCSLTYSYQQSLFPVKSIQFKKSQKENNFPGATTARSVVGQKVQCTKREMTEKARELYTRMNSQFEKTCQVPLAKALVSVPELQLQQKKSKAQMKKEKRDQYRMTKKQIEQEWKETEIIRLVLLCF